MSSTLPDHSALLIGPQGSNKFLRYRFAQAEPNEILVGPDPGIRALAAADAGDTDLIPLSGAGTETLPDYAVIRIPQGPLVNMRFYARHKALSDSTLAMYIYQVQVGDDVIRQPRTVPVMRGVRDPLGIISESDALGTTVLNEIAIDAREAEQKVAYILSGVKTAGAAGNWYCEFEVKTNQ